MSGQAVGRQLHLIAPLPHRFHNQPVLHQLQAFVQRLLCIALANGDFFTADYRSRVDLRRHVMHCATCCLYTSVERLLYHVESPEDGDLCAITRGICVACAVVGDKGGMKIDDASRELFNEACTEDTHPADQYDEVNAEKLQQCSKPRLALRSLLPGQVDHWQVMCKGTLQAVGIGFVAHNQRDLDVRQFLALDGIDKRLQVAARARDEHAKAQGSAVHYRRTSSSAWTSSATRRCLYSCSRWPSCISERASILAASRAAPSGSRITGEAMPDGSRSDERISIPPKRSL